MKSDHKKKLLLVNKFYHPEIGGVETVVAQYAAFARDKFDVTVLCISRNFRLKTSIETIDGVKVIRLSSLGTFFSMPVSISFPYFLWRKGKAADVIHGHYPFPLFDLFSFILPRKSKILLTWHCRIVKQKYLKLLFYPFTRYLLGRSLVTVTSPNMLKSIEYSVNDNFFILPLSHSKECVFNDAKIEGLKDIGGRDLPREFCLSLGRLVPYKGLTTLLEAFKVSVRSEESCMPLVIAGDGPVLKELLEKVDQLDIADMVYILGRQVTEEEKEYLFSTCSFFVLPSISPAEAFGIVQLEAMSVGKPVINTSLLTGVPWVSLNEVSGLTVEPRDVLALSDAILKLSNEEEYRRYLGERACERYKALFSDEVVKKKYLDLLQSIT